MPLDQQSSAFAEHHRDLETQLSQMIDLSVLHITPGELLMWEPDQEPTTA